MPSGKEFRKALKINDITVEQAITLLGISRGTVYNNVKKKELDEDFVQLVQDKLNIDLNAPVPAFLDQRRAMKNADEEYMVPYIDVPAQAGYAKAYQQRDYINTLKKFPILPDVDPAGATWRYFQIEGDSMEPGFRSGDVILCSQVPKDDWMQFNNYHTYVVVTETDLWIKDVYRLSNTEWILLSQNEEHKPFKIAVVDVKQLWVMRRHVKSRAEKAYMYNIEEIKNTLK